MTHVTRIGIDMAKQVFQLHGVDERGHTVLRRRLSRAQVVPFFTQLRPCLVGIEACGSAHYWARTLTALGHDVRLLAPQFVAPYRKTDKNDDHDAEESAKPLASPTCALSPSRPWRSRPC
jgi:transposase